MTSDELVERVRDALDDYGELDAVETTETTGAVDADDVDIPVADSAVADVGDWIYLDYEAMEVRESEEDTLTVRRGGRGTTAATHTSGSIVRVNLAFHNQRILNELNNALSKTFPELFKVVSDETTTIAEDTYEYAVPATIDKFRSVWIESDVGSDNFSVLRTFEFLSDSSIHLYGAYTTGTKLRFIGINRFDRMTAGEDIDDDYPDVDDAYEFLVKDAAGRLLIWSETRTGRDEGRAKSDAKYVNLNTGRQLRDQALDCLNSVRMNKPAYIGPRPDARYF